MRTIVRYILVRPTLKTEHALVWLLPEVYGKLKSSDFVHGGLALVTTSAAELEPTSPRPQAENKALRVSA